MNPFDLRGPGFLGFYVLMSAIGMLLLYLTARGVLLGPQRQPSPGARRHLRDPYLLAYLRGGARESLKTAVFSLHQRKLLNVTETGVVAIGGREALQAVQNPLEHALLSHCSPMPRNLEELLKDKRLELSVESYTDCLREAGLVADQQERQRRRPMLFIIGGALFALSAIKLVVALQRGHSNVVFLILMTIGVMVTCHAIHRYRLTNAGIRALRDQQTLFARLRDRVNRLAADGATNEAVLVAATFGLTALPSAAYPAVGKLRRQARNSSNSSSSSCGSSCGGGGCGGGCGGCGS